MIEHGDLLRLKEDGTQRWGRREEPPGAGSPSPPGSEATGRAARSPRVDYLTLCCSPAKDTSCGMISDWPAQLIHSEQAVDRMHPDRYQAGRAEALLSKDVDVRVNKTNHHLRYDLLHPPIPGPITQTEHVPSRPSAQ